MSLCLLRESYNNKFQIVFTSYQKKLSFRRYLESEVVIKLILQAF